MELLTEGVVSHWGIFGYQNASEIVFGLLLVVDSPVCSIDGQFNHLS